uniref:Fungal-type protein kinase domain-containing protein n=1 Tax=Psilocybe cubensis TaxID=181762 RepID=A0A8H8CNM9_PSICU
MEREFIVCDLDQFMSSYLPFVPSEADVSSCISQCLRPDSMVVGTGDTTRFMLYLSPPDGSQSEMKTYRNLEKISASIAKFEYPGRTRNRFHYKHTPYASIAKSTHKIDACFTADTFSSESKILNTYAMAVPMEHKVDPAQRYDSNTKVVSANVRIMNDDVRRMFTFGITIERDEVTLWFHSRSHSAISKSFSFVYKPKKLIKVFLSILFATEEGLGYDPLITREADSNYTFEIPQVNAPSRFFRTISPISVYNSNNSTGRMTRIYLAEDLSTNPPKRCVLKDVWIDSTEQTEGQIQQALFDDIEAFWKEEPATPTVPGDEDDINFFRSLHSDLVKSKRYKDFFLSIETDYASPALHDVAPKAVPVRGLLTAPAPATPLPPAFSNSGPVPDSARKSPTPRSSLRSAGTTRPMTKARGQLANSKPVAPRRYMPKKRYRVVFREICTPVGNLGKLGEVVDVLQQVLIPLQLMLCAGWVHRDISSGNILAYKSTEAVSDGTMLNWQAKLSDLEYAKKFPPPDGYKGASDPKTGTPYFMAHEVLGRSYIFQPVATEARSVTSDESTNPFAPVSEMIVGVNREVVAHNFQHDLESIWWLLLWTMACRIDCKSSHAWARPIFQNVEDLTEERAHCFCYPINQAISVSFHKDISEFAKPMEKVRLIMHTAYFDRVSLRRHFAPAAYVKFHRLFRLFFMGIQLISTSDWREIPLIPDDLTVKRNLKILC